MQILIKLQIAIFLSENIDICISVTDIDISVTDIYSSNLAICISKYAEILSRCLFSPLKRKNGNPSPVIISFHQFVRLHSDQVGTKNDVDYLYDRRFTGVR